MTDLAPDTRELGPMATDDDSGGSQHQNIRTFRIGDPTDVSPSSWSFGAVVVGIARKGEVREHQLDIRLKPSCLDQVWNRLQAIVVQVLTSGVWCVPTLEHGIEAQGTLVLHRCDRGKQDCSYIGLFQHSFVYVMLKEVISPYFYKLAVSQLYKQAIIDIYLCTPLG